MASQKGAGAIVAERPAAAPRNLESRGLVCYTCGGDLRRWRSVGRFLPTQEWKEKREWGVLLFGAGMGRFAPVAHTWEIPAFAGMGSAFILRAGMIQFAPVMEIKTEQRQENKR